MLAPPHLPTPPPSPPTPPPSPPTPNTHGYSFFSTQHLPAHKHNAITISSYKKYFIIFWYIRPENIPEPNLPQETACNTFRLSFNNNVLVLYFLTLFVHFE